MQVVANSTVGSHINETDFGFTWHFDGVEAEYGLYQSRDLRVHLDQLTTGSPVLHACRWLILCEIEGGHVRTRTGITCARCAACPSFVSDILSNFFEIFAATLALFISRLL